METTEDATNAIAERYDSMSKYNKYDRLSEMMENKELYEAQVMKLEEKNQVFEKNKQ